jgi:hypothetical protein
MVCRVMMRGVRLHRAILGLGVPEAQADHVVEAMSDFATRDDLAREMAHLESRLFAKLLLAMIAVVGVAVAILAIVN